jgi:3-methyladenine DNA glycosylase/8-oxoguanine DNA glycosylase
MLFSASYEEVLEALIKVRGLGKWKYMTEKEMEETAEKFKPYR